MLPDMGELGSIPMPFFEPLTTTVLSPGQDEAHTDPNMAAIPAESTNSCKCVQDVADALRPIRRSTPSHCIIRSLRAATDVAKRLLTCSICYDVSRSPRITIQNVLLLGRILLEISAGYRKYLRWLEDSCGNLVDCSLDETVYIMPGLDVCPMLSLKINGSRVYALIKHGLQDDAAQLTDVVKRFGDRQYYRHLHGHEACPDAEGGCWREEYDIEGDPLDICPQNAAARTLAPCYRIVDEVRTGISGFANAVA